MTPTSLIIVTDRGTLKAYKVSDTPTRGPSLKLVQAFDTTDAASTAIAAGLSGVVLSPPTASQLLPAPVPKPGAAEPTGDPYRRETPYGAFFGYIRAAQKSLENLFGGFLVLSDRIIRVGDTVRESVHPLAARAAGPPPAR